MLRACARCTRRRPSRRSGDDAFVRVVKDVVDELCDHHAGAWPNAPDDRRLVPSTTDLWAEWVDGGAVITAVRAGSAAFAHGFRPGMEIESIDGTPVEDAIRDELPRAMDVPSLRAQEWALRVALSGRLGSPVRVVAKDSDQRVDATFTPGRFTRPDGALVAERLEGGAGYVRFNNSLGENDTVAAFDDALETLRDAPALIIDLRDTPGGGNTTVARGILGRLTAEKRVYQMHSLPMEVREHGIERSWAEFVSPRGPFAYTGEVFVLVGRWTGSMGEGMTLGLDAMGATVIGGPMARLLGATNSYQLGDVNAWVSLPTERLYHADGTAREAFVPGVTSWRERRSLRLGGGRGVPYGAEPGARCRSIGVRRTRTMSHGASRTVEPRSNCHRCALRTRTPRGEEDREIARVHLAIAVEIERCVSPSGEQHGEIGPVDLPAARDVVWARTLVQSDDSALDDPVGVDDVHEAIGVQVGDIEPHRGPVGDEVIPRHERPVAETAHYSVIAGVGGNHDKVGDVVTAHICHDAADRRALELGESLGLERPVPATEQHGDIA